MPMTLASVIIPVWNGIADLPACLAALSAQSHTPLEIIAVDNGSSDASGDWIANHHPEVHLIRNAENLGFGGACNQGLAEAKGEILVLLNQDTVAQPGWMAALVTVMMEDAKIGIAGSKALYADGTIQHAGGTVDAQGGGAHTGYRQVDEGQFDRLVDVDYVTGASLALRRQLYEQIGGFDPGFYPAYLEDVDLCWRARAAGWRVVYAPQSVLIHNERSVAASSAYEGMLLFHRHRLRFVCKHWPIERLRGEFLPTETEWLRSLGPGGERLIAACHHAYLAQLLNLGELAQWRQRLLGEMPETMETVAQLLLSLRTVYPLKLVEFSAMEDPVPPVISIDARPLAEIREQPFHSDVPGIGPLIAGFRQQWNRVSTEWYVKPMIRQQSHFNVLLLDALQQSHAQNFALNFHLNDQVNQQLHQLHAAQQRIDTVLAEYLAGQAREISALAQEVEALKRRLDENTAGG